MPDHAGWGSVYICCEVILIRRLRGRCKAVREECWMLPKCITMAGEDRLSWVKVLIDVCSWKGLVLATWAI